VGHLSGTGGSMPQEYTGTEYYRKSFKIHVLRSNITSLYSLSNYEACIRNSLVLIKIIDDDPIYDREIIHAYLYLGYSYLDMNNKIQGCRYFSKAGEYGSDEAYDIIRDNCNN